MDTTTPAGPPRRARRSRRLLALLLAAPLAVGLLGACQSSGDKGPPDNPNSRVVPNESISPNPQSVSPSATPDSRK